MKAYLSVNNKENVEILIQNLLDKKYEIFADEKTSKLLNLDCVKFAKEKQNYDLVAVDLSNFEQYMNKNIEIETLLKSIEIENVSILRESAKNYKETIVLSDIKDFKIDLDEIDEKKRETLALGVFLKTSKYDFLINSKLANEFKVENSNKAFYFNKLQDLQGENSHQKATLYSLNKELDWVLLNGAELSYNDISDSTLALEVASEFFDVAACIIVKHQNPSVAALGANIEQAFDKVLDSDPISPIDATIAFSKKIDLSLAHKLNAISPKNIVAPEYDFEALNVLKKNKNLKIIQINTPLSEVLKFQDNEIKLTPFGALIQQKDNKDLDVKTFKVETKKKPQQNELEDMIFAYKIVKHVKSSAVVVAKDLRTIGICAGQSNEINALEVALGRVCDSTKDSVVAYDEALNSIENIQIMAQNRVIGAIHSGKKDDNKINELADKYNISVISTGITHLKH